MKKTITLFLAIIAFTISYAQTNVPVTNGDFESTTTMSTTDNKTYTIDGFRILENTTDDIFDETNSGLVSGEGVNGSQALKSKIHNSTGTSFHAVLFTDKIDISNYNPGDYKLSLYIKSEILPTAYPIWMVVIAFDEDGVNVTNNTLVKKNGGGTLNWQQLNTDFQEAYSEFTIVDNPSGKNAKTIELRMQHGRENNTYWFDNLSLTTTATLSTKSFEQIGVSMFPNPASSSTTIKSVAGLKNITLHSLSGQLLLDEKINTNQYNLNVSSFAKGVYVLGVTNEKGKSVTKLLVN